MEHESKNEMPMSGGMPEMPKDMEHMVDHQVSCYGPDTLHEIVPKAPSADAEASSPKLIK